MSLNIRSCQENIICDFLDCQNSSARKHQSVNFEESTKTRIFVTETLKQKIKSTLREKCELEYRKVIKNNSSFCHSRANNFPMRGEKSTTFFQSKSIIFPRLENF